MDGWIRNLPDYHLTQSLSSLETSLKDASTNPDQSLPAAPQTTLPPYETEYSSSNVFTKSQELADIAGFYRAFGCSSDRRERPDHISAELEFMRLLCMMEAYADAQASQDRLEVTLAAQRKFMNDHLGRWIAYFCDQVAANTTNGFQRALGNLIRQFISKEIAALGATPAFVTSHPARSQPADELLSCGA